MSRCLTPAVINPSSIAVTSSLTSAFGWFCNALLLKNDNYFNYIINAPIGLSVAFSACMFYCLARCCYPNKLKPEKNKDPVDLINGSILVSVLTWGFNRTGFAIASQFFTTQDRQDLLATALISWGAGIILVGVPTVLYQIGLFQKCRSKKKDSGLGTKLLSGTGEAAGILATILTT